MKHFLIFLLTICSCFCYAQDYTVSIGQLNYGKIAILDQELKPNDETTLFLSYLPKVGDYEIPTLVLNCPELFDALVGKNVVGYIDNMSLSIETSGGILHYFASRNEETLITDHTEDGSSVGITVFLAKVDIDNGKFQKAKGTHSWAKKTKDKLSKCIIQKIDVKASVYYSTDLNKPLAYRTKDSKYTINVNPEINMSSLLNLLFKKGDELVK